MAPDQDRREFPGTAAGAVAFTIVPGHVLGGQGNVAPSDKITLAMIGVGTQTLRELPALLSIPEVRIVSVCEPCKNAVGYYDWSTADILNSILDEPSRVAGARTAGVKNYSVEMSLDLMKASTAYLHSLKVQSLVDEGESHDR